MALFTAQAGLPLVGLCLVGHSSVNNIAWGNLASRDLGVVEITGSNPVAMTQLGVVKLGITRRSGRRDRRFKSGHLDSRSDKPIGDGTCFENS